MTLCLLRSSQAGKGCRHNAMNVCLADGSVRLLAGSMDRAVWWALVTPAGGERLPNDW